jgi:thiol-disulfide isomerase/thioredoxin
MAIFKETALKTSVDVDFSATTEALGKAAFPDAKQLPCVVLQKEGEDHVIYTPVFGKGEFKAFLHQHESPRLSSSVSSQLADLFLKEGKSKTGVILYRNSNQTGIDAEFALLRDELPDSDLVFAKSAGESGEDQSVAQYLMVTPKDYPVLLVARMVGKEIHRWAFKGEMKKDKMLAFLRSWRDGKAPRSYQTAEPPTNNSGPVFIAVGSTFAQEVLQPDKDVIVKFYAPWCSHCKELAPIYQALAQKLVGQPKLKFVEIDSTANEVEGHPIRGYPVLKLFPAKNKANAVVLNSKTEADILKGIKEHASYPLDNQWKVDL